MTDAQKEKLRQFLWDKQSVDHNSWHYHYVLVGPDEIDDFIEEIERIIEEIDA